MSVEWRFISLRMVNHERDYEKDFRPGYERGHMRGLELLREGAPARRVVVVSVGCAPRPRPRPPEKGWLVGPRGRAEGDRRGPRNAGTLPRRGRGCPHTGGSWALGAPLITGPKKLGPSGGWK